MATLATLMVKLGLDAKNFDKGVGQVEKSAGGLKKTLGGLGKGAMQMGGMAVKGFGLASGAALGLAASSAKVAAVKTTYDNLNASIGETSETMTAKLRAATMGVVSDYDLMLASNKFVAMGLADSAKGAGTLAEMAVTLGTAMGEDATSSMENFALMMANQSIPRLDSFGISSGKVRERILELMDANDSMTREQAFTQAVMEQGAIAMGKVGDTSNTTAMEMARLQATAKNVKDQIGVALLPILAALLKPLGKLAAQIGPVLVPMIEKLAAGFEKLPEPTQKVIAVVMALSAAVVGANAALGIMGMSKIPSLGAAFTKLLPLIAPLGATLGALALPIGLVVAAVALLALAWKTNFGGIREKTAVVWEKIKPIFDTLKAWLAEKLPQAWEKMRQVVERVASFIAGFVTGRLAIVTEWVTENWPLIQQTIETVMGAVRTVVEVTMGAIKVVVETVIGWLSGFWSEHHETIRRVATGIWGAISTLIDTNLKTILGIIKAVMQAINGDWSGAWQTLKDTALNILKSVSGLLDRLFGGWADLARDKAQDFMDAGQAMIQGLIDGIESFIGNVKGIVQRLMESIPQWVKDLLGIHSPSMVMYGLGAEIPRGLASGIVSQIQTVVAALQQLFGAMGKETADKIKAYAYMLSAIGNALSKAVQGIKDVAGLERIANFGKYLNRLFQYLMPAFNRFYQWAQWFTEAPLARVTLLANAVASFVAILSASIAGLKAVGELGPVKAFKSRMKRLADYLEIAVKSIVKVANTFKSKGLAAARRFSSVAGPIVDLLKRAVDGLQAVGDMKKVNAFKMRMRRLADYLGVAVTEIARVAAAFKGKGLAAAQAFAVSAGSVVAILKSAVDGLVAIGDMKAIEDFAGKMVLLAGYLKTAVGAIAKVGRDFGDKALTAAKKFAAAVGPVTNMLKGAVAGIKALFDYESALNLDSLAASLANDLAVVVEQFRIVGETFETAGLDAATAFANAASAVMGLIQTAVEAIPLLAAYVHQEIVGAAAILATDIADIVDQFSEASDLITTVGMDKARAFATGASTVFAFIKTSLDVIATLRDYSSPAEAKTKQFLADVENIVGLVADAVAAMFAIDQEGRFAVLNLYMRGQMAVTQWLQGMIDGIHAKTPAVIAAIQALINDLVGTAEATLGIASPSEAFTDIGALTMQGLIDGILGRARDALMAMSELIERISGVGVTDFYEAGKNSAWEWLRGWADAMRAAELSPVIPATAFGGVAGATTAAGTGTTAGGDTYNLFVTYRNAEDEGSLRDTIRALQMAGA